MTSKFPFNKRRILEYSIGLYKAGSLLLYQSTKILCFGEPVDTGNNFLSKKHSFNNK